MSVGVKPSSMVRVRIFLPLAAALFLCPDPAAAQPRGRISLTPSIGYLLPSSYYEREFQGERSNGEVRIRQNPMALFGAQLSYDLPGTAWRLGLGYARGESDLEVYHYAREGAPPGSGGPPTSSTFIEREYEEPATRELVTLAAARQLLRGPVAWELGTALVHQRLDATTYGGFLGSEPTEGRYTDWGMQLGGAVGPSSGWARGLRVGARVQLLRASPALFEEMWIRSWEPVPDAKLESAIALSLGWRLTF